MSKRQASPHSPVASCPACGAQINVTGSRARLKVQCPQCRQVIELEKPARPKPEKDEDVRIEPAGESAILREQERIALLEARVADLERTLAGLVQAPPKPDLPRKVKWIVGDDLPDYSSAQADALGHNLRTVPSHAIRIQFPCGDSTARSRAEWFTRVFSSAHWRVLGPEDTEPERLTASGLTLATCLPVSPEAAATYLAIRAAGFPLTTIYDQDLRSSEERLIVA